MFFDTKEKRILKKCKSILVKILLLEEEMQSFSNQELGDKVKQIKEKIQKQNIKYNTNNSHYVNDVTLIFAIIRELSWRIRREKPTDSQILAALSLNEMTIIEMHTGQGKTLSAVLSAGFRAIFGEYVHIITANDYLAKRDFEAMNNIYSSIGIHSGYIIQDMSKLEKIKNYTKCNVIYISINQLGFDYLRSNMQFLPSEIMLRKSSFQHVIIDESDFILLDLGTIPIVIGEPKNHIDKELYQSAYAVINTLTKDDIIIDFEKKDVAIKQSAIEDFELNIQKYFQIPVSQIYSKENIDIFFYIDRMLRVKYLFRKNYEYIIHKSKICIVDEYTGRVAEDRKFSLGIQQAIEVKENVELSSEMRQAHYITTQNLFRLYKYISGMTGTAFTERNEFFIVYNTPVVRIPKHENNIIKYHDERFFASKKHKYKFICNVLKNKHPDQPVLIGTSNIHESEEIALYLSQDKIKFKLLNAKKISEEAEIIEQAGFPGSITIATNMAGRGTDIKLGGSIDKKIKNILSLNITDSEKEDMIAKINEEYQHNRSSAFNAGGLLVIITQRQQNRRIDRQFKGRTGRKGDNGELISLVSLEDEIFRNTHNSVFIAKLFVENSEYGITSFVLENIVNRMQYQNEKQMFDFRISTLNQDHAVNQNRNTFFDIREQIVFNKIDYQKVVDGIIKDMKALAINDPRQFLLEYRKYCDNDIEDELDPSALLLTLNEIQESIYSNRVLDSNYNNIKVAFLKHIDSLWSQFINIKGVIYRTKVFVSKIDPILDFNQTMFHLFEEIFFDYHKILLKITLFYIGNNISLA